MYQYGWLDKVTQITEGDKVIRNFHCHMYGQLAAAYDGSGPGPFPRGNFARIRRDGANHQNKPAVTGGNPVINRIVCDLYETRNDGFDSSLTSLPDGKLTRARGLI